MLGSAASLGSLRDLQVPFCTWRRRVGTQANTKPLVQQLDPIKVPRLDLREQPIEPRQSTGLSDTRLTQYVAIGIAHSQPPPEEALLESHRHVVLLVPHRSPGHTGAELFRTRAIHHG